MLSNTPGDLYLGDPLFFWYAMEEFLVIEFFAILISTFFAIWILLSSFRSLNPLWGSSDLSYLFSPNWRPEIWGSLALWVLCNIYSFFYSNLMCWNAYWVLFIEEEIRFFINLGEGIFLDLLSILLKLKIFSLSGMMISACYFSEASDLHSLFFIFIGSWVWSSIMGSFFPMSSKASWIFLLYSSIISLNFLTFFSNIYFWDSNLKICSWFILFRDIMSS